MKDEEDNAICENCAQPVPADEIQTCSICGMECLGNCCIGQEDHPCRQNLHLHSISLVIL